jgi:two-component system, OmpR family, response regulator
MSSAGIHPKNKQYRQARSAATPYGHSGRVLPTAIHPKTHGALALVDLDQIDTQPLPSIRPTALRRQILVVEDDSQVASVIHASLELEGEPDWTVQLASGGRHALELASTTPPDLVLLDVRLPDLDGAQVYRRLRTSASTRGARILFLSAGTSFDLFQLGIEDGVLLRKPFYVPELVSLVRALLHG